MIEARIFLAIMLLSAVVNAQKVQSPSTLSKTVQPPSTTRQLQMVQLNNLKNQIKLPLPDLVISDVILEIDNKNMKVLVENLGNGPAPSSLLTVTCFDTYQHPVENCIIVQTVAALPPHKSMWVKAYGPSDPDVMGFETTINAEHKIKETSYSNDRNGAFKYAYGPLTYAPAGSDADLVPLQIFFPSIQDGKNLLKMRLINRGGTASTGFYVTFYMIRNSGGKELGGTFVKSVAAGADVWVSLELPMPPPPADPPPLGSISNPFSSLGYLQDPIRYMVVVDSQHTVKESDDKNNVLSLNTFSSTYSTK